MNHMGIDQYNTTYHDLGPHPRKELLVRLGRKHAAKMYVDKKDGKSAHIGYVIARLWITLYEVKRIDHQERNPRATQQSHPQNVRPLF